MNDIYRVTCCGEPQLGKRGLYPSLSTKKSGASVAAMMDLITYADGTNDLVSISKLVGQPVWDLNDIALRLKTAGLLKKMEESTFTRSSAM